MTPQQIRIECLKLAADRMAPTITADPHAGLHETFQLARTIEKFVWQARDQNKAAADKITRD